MTVNENLLFELDKRIKLLRKSINENNVNLKIL